MSHSVCRKMLRQTERGSTVTLVYLRKDAATDVPFWRMVAAPVGELQERAERIVETTHTALAPLVLEAAATEAMPGAGSAPARR